MAVTFDNISNGRDANINTNGYTNFLAQLNKTDEGMNEVFKTYSDIADNNYANQVKQKTGNIMGALQSGQLASLEGVDLSNTDAEALSNFMEKKEATDAAELHQSNMLSENIRGNKAQEVAAALAATRGNEARIAQETYNTNSLNIKEDAAIEQELLNELEREKQQQEIDKTNKGIEVANIAATMAGMSKDELRTFRQTNPNGILPEVLQSAHDLFQTNKDKYFASEHNEYALEQRNQISAGVDASLLPTKNDTATTNTLIANLDSTDSKIAKNTRETVEAIFKGNDRLQQKSASYYVEEYNKIEGTPETTGLGQFGKDIKQTTSQILAYGNPFNLGTSTEALDMENIVSSMEHELGRMTKGTSAYVKTKKLLDHAKADAKSKRKGSKSYSSDYYKKLLKESSVGIKDILDGIEAAKNKNP